MNPDRRDTLEKSHEALMKARDETELAISMVAAVLEADEAHERAKQGDVHEQLSVGEDLSSVVVDAEGPDGKDVLIRYNGIVGFVRPNGTDLNDGDPVTARVTDIRDTFFNAVVVDR